jgi:SSS family solute:Na+ symporter
MVNNLLPIGLKGLVAAALLAALMSTVSGALNSIATLFSYDILKRYIPNISDKTMIFSGRIVTVIAMIAAIIWSPFVGHYNSIFQGMTAIICYIAPPISAVFLMGIFWSRASATAALTTLWGGSFLGFIVFILDWFKNSTHWSIPPMMSAFYLFVICLILMIIVSLLNKQYKNNILVWRNLFEAFKSDKKLGILDYRIVAALLIAIFISLYIIFK